MKIIIGAITLLLSFGLSSIVHASWQAGEYEGSATFLAASVQNDNGGLYVICDGGKNSESFDFRFNVDSNENWENLDGKAVRFEISIDGRVFNIQNMQYSTSEVDFEARINKKNRLLKQIKSGNVIVFREVEGRVPRVEFSLKGAARALTKLERNCR